MKKTIATTAITIMQEAIRADRNHSYELTADYVVGRFNEKVLDKYVPDYECEAFDIKDGLLTIHKGFNDCDGATCAPDKLIIDIAKGFFPHDAGYAELERMAADPRWIANGWTFKDIRKLWDIVFGQCLQHSANKQTGIKKKGAHLIARIYYHAVRWFGGIFHRSAKIIIIATIIAVALSGCCIPDGFTPTDDEPIYTLVEATNETTTTI